MSTFLIVLLILAACGGCSSGQSRSGSTFSTGPGLHKQPSYGAYLHEQWLRTSPRCRKELRAHWDEMDSSQRHRAVQAMLPWLDRQGLRPPNSNEMG